jgi:hypothetical protein
MNYPAGDRKEDSKWEKAVRMILFSWLMRSKKCVDGKSS